MLFLKNNWLNNSLTMQFYSAIYYLFFLSVVLKINFSKIIPDKEVWAND